MSLEKPPIGILPKSIWDEKRHDEIFQVIHRYLDAGLPLPTEWIEEYNEYLKEKRHNENTLN